VPPPSQPKPGLPGDLAATPVLRRWLDFGVDGVVTIATGKVEYGQGVWTALAQIAAEELDVRLDRVRVAPVSTATSPDEGVTSGSKSIEDSGAALRQACAQARRAVLAAAADRLGADRAALGVRDGEIVTASGGTGLSYWSLGAPGLLDGAAGPPAAAKPAARWSVAGRSAPRIDLPDKVTGRPRFLQDLVLPGMLFGRVVRPPAVAAELQAVGQADLPAGVIDVVTDGSFLGVVAETDAAARAAARRLCQAARWKVRDSLPDENDLRSFLLGEPAETSVIARSLDTAAAARATRTLTAEFSRPFLAHASMAPSCAIAQVQDGTVTVWAHSQGIFALRRALAVGLGIEPRHLVVRHAEGAGAYGHNGADDAALDAVLLARAPACCGRPVRVMWSREDEMAWAPLGAAMLARLSAGLDPDGRIQSWRQDVWSNGFLGRRAPGASRGCSRSRTWPAGSRCPRPPTARRCPPSARSATRCPATTFPTSR
jgi:nicotinate dehydrogenase subunit B